MLETYFRLTRGLIGRAPEEKGDDRLRQALVPRARRRLYQEEARAVALRSVAAGLLAEASWRLPGRNFLLTEAATSLHDVTFDQLIVVSLQVPAGASAPPGAAWHQTVYAHTTASAALLSQPPAAMTLLARGTLPAPDAWPAAYNLLGAGAIMGSGDEPAGDRLAAGSFLLLAAHGLLTWASSLVAAAATAETVERWAEITLKGERLW